MVQKLRSFYKSNIHFIVAQLMQVIRYPIVHRSDIRIANMQSDRSI